jgi:hypothetical protein
MNGGGSPQRRLAALSGGGFLLLLVALAILVPRPEPFQYAVFRVLLALAAAAFASTIPGLLHVTVSTFVKATGAIAVFVIVYFFSPANLVTQDPHVDGQPQPREQSPDTAVSIAPLDTAVSIGSRFSLRPVVTVGGQPRTPSILHFFSNDPRIAGVTRGGDVIALAHGRTAVGAEIGSRIGEAVVGVRTPPSANYRPPDPSCKPFTADTVVAHADARDSVASGSYLPLPGDEAGFPLGVDLWVCSGTSSFRAIVEYAISLPIAARSSSAGLVLIEGGSPRAFFRGPEDQPADGVIRFTIDVQNLGPGGYGLRPVHYSAAPQRSVQRVFKGPRRIIVTALGRDVT